MRSLPWTYIRRAGMLLPLNICLHITKLPFALSVSPYHIQMFTNIIVQRFRDGGLTVWGHIDDVVLGRLDKVLSSVLHDILTDLCRAKVLINWKKSILHPRRKLAVLGAIFNTITNEVTLSDDRRALIDRIFEILTEATHLRKLTLPRFIGQCVAIYQIAMVFAPSSLFSNRDERISA